MYVATFAAARHQSGMKGSVKSIFTTMTTHLNAGNADWRIWPSVKTLAFESGWSTRTVRRAIRKLAARGQIKVTPQFQSHGGPGSNLIEIDPSLVEGVVTTPEGETTSPEAETTCPEGGDKLAPKPITETEKEPIRIRENRKTISKCAPYRSEGPLRKALDRSGIRQTGKTLSGGAREGRVLDGGVSVSVIGSAQATVEASERASQNGAAMARGFRLDGMLKRGPRTDQQRDADLTTLTDICGQLNSELLLRTLAANAEEISKAHSIKNPIAAFVARARRYGYRPSARWKQWSWVMDMASNGPGSAPFRGNA